MLAPITIASPPRWTIAPSLVHEISAQMTGVLGYTTPCRTSIAHRGYASQEATSELLGIFAGPASHAFDDDRDKARPCACRRLGKNHDPPFGTTLIFAIMPPSSCSRM